MILSCKDISKSFGAETVLKNVTFMLEEKEKAAVVGVNGAGKTTLFKILTGELDADGGEIAQSRTASVGYLEQIPQVDGGTAIFDVMLTVFEKLITLEERMREMERGMAAAEGEGLLLLMEQYERTTHEFELLRGYEYKSRIRGVLRGLGFSEDEFMRAVGTLSGGEKTRVALAGLLLSEPDILLLDEPTNHLDLDSVEWLEEYLKDYPGSMLIISHDRYFLDKLATKVVELQNGRSTVYNGNYSEYAHKREVDRELMLRHYMDQQKQIKRQEAVIEKLRSFNREKSIKRAESREKLLNKLERLEKPESLDKIRMRLMPARRSGTDVLTVQGLSKSYGDRCVFRDVGFEIKRGEKVALVGPNGIGKTTLVRLLLSELAPDSGSYVFGQNVTAQYYDQEHENLDTSKTVLGELQDSYPRLTLLEVRNALAAFMFTGDDVNKRISALSGGERGRVALAKLMLGNANLLVLDEPTNHLDVYSREVLEDALAAYGGTVLYISHDRYFIQRTAGKIIELSADGVTVYDGGYDYYLEKKRTPVMPAPAVKRQVKRKDAGKSVRSRLERLEEAIAGLEAERKRADEALHTEAGADFERAGELYAAKTELDEQLEGLYEEWEELMRQSGQ